MLTKQKIKTTKFNTALKTSFLLLSILLILTVRASAQTTDAPVMQDYKGVKLGMTADEVRDKLGKAKSEDKDGFFYVFSDDEMAQVLLDGDQKVKVISVTYSGDFKNPPSCEDIFGKGVKPETKPSGTLYKRVTFPKNGYWVAYSRTAGDKPTVSVMFNKM